MLSGKTRLVDSTRGRTVVCFLFLRLHARYHANTSMYLCDFRRFWGVCVCFRSCWAVILNHCHLWLQVRSYFAFRATHVAFIRCVTSSPMWVSRHKKHSPAVDNPTAPKKTDTRLGLVASMSQNHTVGANMAGRHLSLGRWFHHGSLYAGELQPRLNRSDCPGP